MRVVTWNINGWKSVVRKGVLLELLRDRRPDIVCLQELKVSDQKEVRDVDWVKELDYVCYIHIERPGYSGTMTMIRSELVTTVQSVEMYGIEGRAVIVRFKNTCLINVYTPNSGVEALGRLDFRVKEWDATFRELVKREMTHRKVVVVGDLNVARTCMDVHKPESKNKSAGYTPEERESFEKLLSETKLVDLWRHVHPSDRAYSYWSYMRKARERDAGWRIDYVLTDPDFSNLEHCEILGSVMGSDHAPIEVNGLKIE